MDTKISQMHSETQDETFEFCKFANTAKHLVTILPLTACTADTRVERLTYQALQGKDRMVRVQN